MYIGLHVKHTLFFVDLNILDTFSIVLQVPNFVKKYPSSGSRVAPCGRTDRQTGIKITVVRDQNRASTGKTAD